MKVWLRKSLYWLIGLLITVILWIVLQLPLFASLNNLVLDLIAGHETVRSEVVVVGIDDNSLQSIGSWPWERQVFATALSNLAKQQPQVIGIDVLFLESRAGDTELSKVLSEINTPVVLGSKLVDNQTLRSIFTKDKVKSGFVNFQPDFDGKIRRTQVSRESGQCELSFALSVMANYLQIPDNLCGTNIKLRNQSFQTNANHELQFSYTKESFSRISFNDVYRGTIPDNFFKDKIVLIGSTAVDVRSNLNDNFTDIFGRSIPGIEIHANIINSFLQNSFYTEVNQIALLAALLLIFLIFGNIHLRVKRAAFDSVIFLCAILLNFLAGLILLPAGLLWPILPVTIIIVVIYIYSLLYRYLTQNRENRYIKQMFGKYVNPKLMQQLLQTPDQLKLGGETRTMSVMFSDIRSFTTMSEGMTPAELINMLNDYLNFMSGIILRHDGTIDKYIGDAIMAFWNAPIPDADYITKSVDTALDMQTGVMQFRKTYPNYPQINIGIGVNAGPMTVGNVGGDARFDYTVLGDDVNLGSRLEGLTKYYHLVVLCTQTLVDGYQGGAIFRIIDEVKVKGKVNAVKIFEPMIATVAARKLKDIYEAGFALYQAGKFEQAIVKLKSISSDGPASLLLERIHELKTPPADWDGVWKWDSK